MTPRQLREFRNRLGMSQQAFAKGIGVAPNTIARWERGELGMRESTKRYLKFLVDQVDLTDPVWPAPLTNPEGDK
ncbi:MAG TPA: helix-turn-helix domain-containing protein [Vicinamibacterales bacterium]|nr:helix-turn-helix domain-containing protein [Vicinamibacterales bacterium]